MFYSYVQLIGKYGDPAGKAYTNARSSKIEKGREQIDRCLFAFSDPAGGGEGGAEPRTAESKIRRGRLCFIPHQQKKKKLPWGKGLLFFSSNSA